MVSLAFLCAPANLCVMSRIGGDGEFVARIQHGDRAAIRDLFNEHFGSLADYAASFLRSAEAAEDLIADIFSWIIANPERFKPVGSVRVYMLWLVRNRALDVLRGQKREYSRYELMMSRGDEAVTLTPVAAPDEGVTENAEAEHVNEKILKALDALSPTAQSVVVLRMRQGLEYAEIAEVVGLSETAVRMQLSRALRTLRERL